LDLIQNPKKKEVFFNAESYSESKDSIGNDHMKVENMDDMIDDDCISSEDERFYSDNFKMNAGGIEDRRLVTNIQPHMRQIDAFVIFANADGSFNFTSEFEQIINIKRIDILNAMPTQISDLNMSNKEKFDIWVTIISISFLEKNFKQEEFEWALIADKAKKFVLKKADSLDVNSLVLQAKLLL